MMKLLVETHFFAQISQGLLKYPCVVIGLVCFYLIITYLEAREAGQGWRQDFLTGGLTLPTRGLKYGFQGALNAKNLRKNRFSFSDGGGSMLRLGAIAP